MLVDFPVCALKVDRVFVHDVELHQRRRDLLGGMVELARRMRIHLVAEGIETPLQLETVRDLGVREGQGFLFATPLSPDAIGALLEADAPLLPRRRSTP